MPSMRRMPRKQPDGKYCRKCGENKPASAFQVQSAKKNGLSSWCKECLSTYRNQGKHKAKSWSRLYGLTPEGYTALLNKQSGVCAICGESETRIHRGSTMMLAVDHDHKTGLVRGLLCKTCNAAIGYFKDDVALLEKAILYLRAHSSDDSIQTMPA